MHLFFPVALILLLVFYLGLFWRNGQRPLAQSSSFTRCMAGIGFLLFGSLCSLLTSYAAVRVLVDQYPSALLFFEYGLGYIPGLFLILSATHTLYRQQAQSPNSGVPEQGGAPLEMVKNAIDVMAILQEQRWVYVNPAITPLCGYSKKEFLSNPPEKIFHEQDKSRLKQRLAILPAPHEFFREDFTLIHHDGQEVEVKLTVSSLVHKGKPAALISFTDISEWKISEKQLLDSEERYRAFSQSTHEAIFFSKDGVCIEANEAASRMFGYRYEDLIGIFGTDVIADQSKELVKQNMLSGIEAPYEAMAARQDGTTFPAEFQGTMFEYRGQSVRVTAVRDLTAKKRIEDEATRSELRYREIFDAIGDAIFIHAADTGEILEMNSTAFAMFGYHPDQLEHLNLEELSSGEPGYSGDDAVQRVARCMTEGPQRFNWLSRRSTGEFFWSEVYLKLSRIGEYSRVIALVRDISKGLETERALAESEKRYRLLIENANEAIFIAKQGRITFTNQKTLDYLGYEPDEVIDQEFSRFIHPEDRQMVAEYHKKRLEGNEEGLPSSYPIRIIASDGSIMTLLLSVVLVDWEGEPAALTFAHDITELKQLEEQVRHSQKMESLGTLAGGIAHDFNNLLMGIQGNISLLQESGIADTAESNRLDDVESQIRLATELTNQLLGLARSGKYEVKVTQLNELIKDTATMFHRTHKELNLSYNCAEDLWLVEVDRGQITQVLLNLLVNGWQAMPEGGLITITTTNVYAAEAVQLQGDNAQHTKLVRLEIGDNGRGIDKEHLDQIFDPFFTTKAKGGGTGLGLASSYGIIRNHHGNIIAESEIGRGTKITIYLPATSKNDLPEAVTGEAEITRGKGETILLIDDEKIVLQIASEMLSVLGYEVLQAESGQEGLDIFMANQDRIDLVLIDMIMPGMGGGELFDNLISIDPELKTMLSSGYSIDGQAAKILDKGCRGFIQKPYSLDDLASKIRAILDQ